MSEDVTSGHNVLACGCEGPHCVVLTNTEQYCKKCNGQPIAKEMKVILND